MALIDLFNPLLAAIKRALGPFGKLFDILTKFWQRLTSLWSKITELVASIQDEIQAWRRFKTDVTNYRTGVISIPAAVRKIRDTIDALVAARDAIIDLWQNLKGKITVGNPFEEAEQAIKDIEAFGSKEILSKFPRLIKGVEKVLGFIAIVADVLESLLDAVDDLVRIVDAIRQIREDAEQTVFLSQSNPRRTVKLQDGGRMKIRLGNLHS